MALARDDARFHAQIVIDRLSRAIVRHSLVASHGSMLTSSIGIYPVKLSPGALKLTFDQSSIDI